MRRFVPWTRQPPPGTRIDWANPLTNGLVDVFSPLDPRTWSLAGGSAQPIPTAQGLGWGAGTSVQSRTTYPASLWSNSTIVAVATVAPLHTDLQYYHSLFADTYSASLFGVVSYDWAVYNPQGVAGAGATAPLGAPVVVAGTYGASALALWVDGQQAATVSFTPSNHAAGLGIGAALVNGPTSDPWNGTISLVSLYNRQLAAHEIVALAANPWQIYLPRKRRAIGTAGSIFTASLAESAAAADALTARATDLAALAESASAAATLTAVAAALAAVAESGAALDALSCGGTAAAALAEAAAAADDLAALADAVAALASAGSAADALTAAAHDLASLAEAADAADALSAAASAVTALASAGAASDAVAAAATGAASLADGGSAADALSATGGLFAMSLAEAASAADALSAAAIEAAALSSAGAAADLLAAVARANSAIAETGSAVDELVAFGDFAAAVVNAASAQDALDWVAEQLPLGAARVTLEAYARRVVLGPYSGRYLVVAYTRRTPLN